MCRWGWGKAAVGGAEAAPDGGGSCSAIHRRGPSSSSSSQSMPTASPPSKVFGESDAPVRSVSVHPRFRFQEHWRNLASKAPRS